MSALIGGRYSAMQQLGAGGFGAVYLAYDTQSQRNVAVKFLVKATKDAVERFGREARILGSRQTQHVVEFIDANFANAPPYIVMEYCECGSLRSWVGAGRSWKDVVAALSHVIVGLDELHAGGGFHRDIKPDNLLVAKHPTEPGKVLVKLGDFGLARAPTALHPSMTRNGAGTEGYIAPEVCRGGLYTAAADIYSLGVVALELLTGTRNPATIEVASIPLQLKSLLRSMLHDNPILRPTAPGVAEAFATLLNANAPVLEGPSPNAPAVPSDSDGVLLGGLIFAGVIVALLALAGGKK